MTCSITNAHEFWIQPDHFALNTNNLVVVRLMHGERFKGDTVDRNDPQIKRFEFVSEGDQTTPIRGRHQNPNGFLRPQHSGVIVYQSNHYTNNLEHEKFNSYLIEEGLEHIINERAHLGESEIIGREAYSRCAKSIIRINDDNHSADKIDRRVGLPLEILIESITPLSSDSESMRTTIIASVSFMDDPIEGLRVVVANTINPEVLIELHTDANGKIAFEAEPAGDWMITTIHIQRAINLEASDWESFWASTTFTNEIQ
ncbi:MAG: DUF4198 domain-containing protein [Phycisphaerales bacterium]|nr:DUF4198 domain-containing protein [Phycisphaerales bacterium]